MTDKHESTVTRARPSSFASRASPMLLGNCGYAAAQFVVLVILARELGATEVGIYVLALAVTAPIQLGLGLRLRTVRSVDHTATPFATYLRLSMSLAVLAFAVSAVVGWVTVPIPRFLVIVALVAGAKGVESIIDVCYGEYQRADRLTAIATSQLLRAAVTVLVVLAGARLAGLAGALAALALGWTAQLLLLDHRRASQELVPVEPRAPVDSARALIRRSWPLGLAAAVSSLSVSVPRFTVAGLLDAGELGVFAILAYPTAVVTILANSMGQACVRSMSTLAVQGAYRTLASTLGKMVVILLLLGAAGAVAALVFGQQAVDWVLAGTYEATPGLLLLLVAGATAAGLATVASYLLVSTGRFGWQPIVVGVSVVLAMPLMYIATQHVGLVGTAASILVMYALQTLLTVVAAIWCVRRARLESGVHDQA